MNRKLVMIIAVLALLCRVRLYAENIDPRNDHSQYAYGENIGWLNFEPGTGDGVHVHDNKLTGWIWAENMGWISMSCENTSSCDNVDYGVSKDGYWNLSGYAWAENAGWISFSCQNTASCERVNYGVRINPDGRFEGWAWGENTGWIHMSSDSPVVYVVRTAASVNVRGIDLDFVTIRNPHNPADSTGYGAVDHIYSIGKYEVTNAQWDAFVADVGAPPGFRNGSYIPGEQQPASNVSWIEAVQFCNYLTSGDKSKGVYRFAGDNSDPGDFLGVDRTEAVNVYGEIFFIPTENEWYKAAYYKPDGDGYSLYANGLSTIPLADHGWNYIGGDYVVSWEVGTGTQEQNGTYDMMGNIFEWNETNTSYIYRGMRGGSWASSGYLASTSTASNIPTSEFYNAGFRIATNMVTGPCGFTIPGDLDASCNVDNFDFAELSKDWLRPYNFIYLLEMLDSWLVDCNTDPSNPACTPL